MTRRGRSSMKERRRWARCAAPVVFLRCVEDVSGAARLRERDCGGGGGADGSFRSGERAEKKRKPPAPIFIAPSGNGRTTAQFSERRTVTAPWNSVATSVAVCSKHMLGHRIGSSCTDPVCRSTEKTRRRGRLVKCTQVPGESG